MALLVVGSVGLDRVETPYGSTQEELGGAAVYFALAACHFAPVRLVGVVGDDCPEGFLKPVHDNPRIDMTGLEVRSGSRTFRWHGRYHEDVNERDTVNVELNVLDEVGPTIPEPFRDSECVFLANTHPHRQIETLAQLASPKLVVADTMDLWITTELEALRELLGLIDGLVLNDSEAKLLTGKPNVVAAGMEIAGGVRNFVVIKKGEHGSLLLADGEVATLPGYPTANVVDPTGAGDCFAGAMMGCLADEGRFDAGALRRAIAYGTVTASIELEDFSINRLLVTTREDIDARLEEFRRLVAF